MRPIVLLLAPLVVFADGFQVVEHSSGWQTVKVSMTDVNRLFCERGNVRMVVYSQEKEMQVKYEGKNVFVKFVPKEKDGKTIVETYPREIYVDCDGEVFQLILKPEKIPAQTVHLKLPYKPPQEKAKQTESSPLQELIATLFRSVYQELVPDGYSVVFVNQQVKSFQELDLVLYRKYEGYEYAVYEYLITAKLDITLWEGSFLPYLERPLAISIVKPILKAGETTRMFVLTKHGG